MQDWYPRRFVKIIVHHKVWSWHCEDKKFVRCLSMQQFVGLYCGRLKVSISALLKQLIVRIILKDKTWSFPSVRISLVEKDCRDFCDFLMFDYYHKVCSCILFYWKRYNWVLCAQICFIKVFISLAAKGRLCEQKKTM